MDEQTAGKRALWSGGVLDDTCLSKVALHLPAILSGPAQSAKPFVVLQ